MKKIENSFAVTGGETKRVSAFMAVEVWRKNESASFELLKKGQIITIHGYFKPEE